MRKMAVRRWVALPVLLVGATLGYAQSVPRFFNTTANESGAIQPAAPGTPAADAHVSLTASLSEVQPILPIVPNAPSYTRLSTRDKFRIFARQTYSPYTFAGAAFDAGWAQLNDDWPGYGQGMEGYGKRYGALMADREAGVFFQSFLLPSILHQDPRYFRMGPSSGVVKRATYAASRVFITRDDDGHNAFNTSLVLGTLIVKALTNAYYPVPQRGFSETGNRFGGSLLSSAQTNVIREFWPDITRIFRKHEPDSMKRLEDRFPIMTKQLGLGPDSNTVESSAQLAPPAQSLEK